MERLVWLANPYSPHVRHWLEVIKIGFGSKKQVDIFHIHHADRSVELSQYEFVNYTCPVPNFMKLMPSYFQYIFLGFYLKLKFRKLQIVHAHNSSGYGLSALLSGKTYILTTYGSEVYKATSESCNLIYKNLIKKIIKNAGAITSSSIQMTLAIKKLWDHPNVYEFSMGVSESFFFSEELRLQTRRELGIPNNAIVILSNRRITPLYNINIILEAFNEVVRERNNIYLIQIEGDSDKTYAHEIINDLHIRNFIFLEGFLRQSYLNELLCASDYTISLPNTDQLSSSIIEGLACESIPILSDIKAYEPLNKVSIKSEIKVDSLVVIFNEVLDGVYSEKLTHIDEVLNKYSIYNASEVYQGILNDIY
ncbi:glycosyltransferase [Vibrio vulnificus]|nr:glycosyltransferase [Vibrio vulnificus]